MSKTVKIPPFQSEELLNLCYHRPTKSYMACQSCGYFSKKIKVNIFVKQNSDGTITLFGFHEKLNPIDDINIILNDVFKKNDG